MEPASWARAKVNDAASGGSRRSQGVTGAGVSKPGRRSVQAAYRNLRRETRKRRRRRCGGRPGRKKPWRAGAGQATPGRGCARGGGCSRGARLADAHGGAAARASEPSARYQKVAVASARREGDEEAAAWRSGAGRAWARMRWVWRPQPRRAVRRRTGTSTGTFEAIKEGSGGGQVAPMAGAATLPGDGQKGTAARRSQLLRPRRSQAGRNLRVALRGRDACYQTEGSNARPARGSRLCGCVEEREAAARSGGGGPAGKWGQRRRSVVARGRSRARVHPCAGRAMLYQTDGRNARPVRRSRMRGWAAGRKVVAVWRRTRWSCGADGWWGKGRARTAAFEQGSQQGGRESRFTTTPPGCFGWHRDTVRLAALALLLVAPDELLPPRAGGRGAGPHPSAPAPPPRARRSSRRSKSPAAWRSPSAATACCGERAPRLHGVQAAGDAASRQRRLRRTGQVRERREHP